MRKSIFKPTFTPGSSTFPCLAAVLLGAATPLLGFGCSGGPPTIASGSPVPSTVSGSATVYNRSTHALMSGALIAVNGTYGPDCVNHQVPGAGSWSLPLNGNLAALLYPALTVVVDNAACELVLTSLEADMNYAASPAITLASTFQPAGSAFAAAAQPIAFYGNADLSVVGVGPVDFSTDFVVNIVYSDDPSTTTGSNSAMDVVSATAQSTLVASPNYVLAALTSITVFTTPGNIVRSSTGSANFTDGMVPTQLGESYVVVQGAFSATATPTFAEDDAAFTGAGTPTAVGEPLTIPSTSFLANGVDLTGGVLRTVIVQHADSGVVAYQVFAITFNPAP